MMNINERKKPIAVAKQAVNTNLQNNLFNLSQQNLKLNSFINTNSTANSTFSNLQKQNYSQPFNSVSSVSSSSTSSCSENLNNNNTSYRQQQQMSASELNYKNYQLQQALKAATAALQKSKIIPINTTTSLFTDLHHQNQLNNSCSKTNSTSTNNLTQHSFKPYSKPKTQLDTAKTYRNTLIIEAIPVVNETKVNTSDYDNLDEDNIDISLNINSINNKKDSNNQQYYDSNSNNITSCNNNNKEHLDNEVIISSLLSSSSSSASASSSLSSSSSSASNASTSSSSSSKKNSKSYSSSSNNNNNNLNHSNLNIASNLNKPDLVKTGLKSAFSSINLNNNSTNNMNLNNSDYHEYKRQGKTIEIIKDKDTKLDIKGLLLDGIENSVNNNRSKLSKKQKSASIDHLNIAVNNQSPSFCLSSNNTSNYNYEDLNCNNDKSSNNGELTYFYDNMDHKTNQLDSNKKQDQSINTSNNGSNLNKLPPPPHIQPYSGVLSKSLFSVVLKPQPVKPVVNALANITNNKNSNLLGSDSNLNTNNKDEQNQSKIKQAQVVTNQQQQIPSSSSVLFRNKLLVKKKCVSTTNLKFNENNQIENLFAPLNHKSVTFIDENDDDDLECAEDVSNEIENYEHVEIVVNEPGDSNNSTSTASKRIAQIEKCLKQKTNELAQVKQKLKKTQEQHEKCMRQRELNLEELEEEKQIYEQKLNAMRVHFNQQLSLFEQNERQCMQERYMSLQQCYNDLKLNYQKNLDNDLKHLRQKLNESHILQQQLIKQIQDLQNNNKCNCSSNNSNKVNKQSSNKLSEQNDLMSIIKQIKQENNELKFQLSAERDKFQIEKDKWLNEKRRVLQFQTYLSQQQQAPFANNGSINNNNNSNSNLSKQMKLVQTMFQNQVVNNQSNLAKSQQQLTNLNSSTSIPIQQQQHQINQRQSQQQHQLQQVSNNNKLTTNPKFMQQNNFL